MNVGYTNNYAFKVNNNVSPASKGPKAFAGNSVPAFGASARLAQDVVRGAVKSPVAGRLRQFISKLVKQTGDDVVRTNVFKKALANTKSLLKKTVAYCAAAITGSVLFVREMGDDIKLKMKTRFKPVSIMKDAASKVKNKVKLMNQVDYYQIEKLQTGGPGVTDILDRTVDGASKALGVELKKSGKSYVWNKLQSIFTRANAS